MDHYIHIEVEVSGEIYISEPYTKENVTLNSPWNGFVETNGFILLTTGETGSMIFASNKDPQKSPYFISGILRNK